MERTLIANAVSATLRTDLLVWVDLETTGLDVDEKMNGMHKHKIIEIGIHITDTHYNIVDEGFSVIVHQDKDTVLSLLNDYVLNMHTKNGLLDRVEASTVSLEEAEQMAIAYINSFSIKHGSSRLCGNSISLDMNFIQAQMPDFAKVFHYRKLDVSSFKIVAWHHYPEEAAKFVKKECHRALDDIKESIAEMNHYKTTMLK